CAPFNVQNINGLLYVTYAKREAGGTDDVAGHGNGFVDIFTTSGFLVKRLVKHGHLNSPWGLALAPPNFGKFSNALLVGNFGDGRISAFDPNTGQFLGQMRDTSGRPIRIDGLWGLRFGFGYPVGDGNVLFFAAGPDRG